jgi:uncharacterized membrane protein HdeD (DUF308 family)
MPGRCDRARGTAALAIGLLAVVVLVAGLAARNWPAVAAVVFTLTVGVLFGLWEVRRRR